MSIKNRLTKLEKILGKFLCPRCRDSDIRPICTYEEEPDGTRRLVPGTPPTACPDCGRIPAGDGISEIIIVCRQRLEVSEQLQAHLPAKADAQILSRQWFAESRTENPKKTSLPI